MWVLFAITTSIVNAIYYLCNQNTRLSTSVFMIYRGFVVALLAVPFLSVYQPVGAWQFYAIAILQGLLVSYNDLQYLKTTRRYGAETVSSITPLSVAVVFGMWCFIEPMILRKYMSSPVRSLCIIAALCGIVYALMQYQRVRLSKAAFIMLIPVILVSTIVSVCNKTIMNYAEDSAFGLCWWRVFVTSLTIGIIHLILYIKRRENVADLTAKQNLIGTWIFILMPMSMVSKNMAMFYTANPAYVEAIVYMSLLWLMLFNRKLHFIKFKKMYMPMNKKWALLMLVSAIVLIVATH
ncbi:MAG: hypothetical protein J6X42_03115 [Alphaproteobacteria bacterium]|nr:hypothetical protein [Alphaproteobacteria bacterium]